MSCYRDVLADLSQLDKSDFDGALTQLLRTDAHTLAVARVSYWSLDPTRTWLTCNRLVTLEARADERGAQIDAASFPLYFASLRESRSIVAHDVATDPRTLELEPYFKPLGVTSMLDVPVWHAGKLCGVICHEHVGEARRWSADEQDFAGSVADMIAVALEARARSRADERFRLLALATGDIAWEMDLLTGVIDWNAGTSAALKYPPEKLTGTKQWWIDQIHPDDRSRVVTSINAAITACANWNDEYRFLLGDGSYAIFADRGFIVCDSSAKPVRMLGAMENVTEKKTLKAKLEISDRMASVGTLAAGVAHEINNPLAYIKSNIEYAVSELKSGVKSLDEVFEVLGDALEGVERVRVIVRDLKHFSRVDDTTARPVALEPLIESTLGMAWNEVRHRAVLVKDFHATPMVLGHEARLGQVILNLIVNAAQAIKDGAREKNRIWVRTFTDPDGWAVIEVEDTGPGIPAELRARVFDPFFSTKPQGGGTGLGLSICHGLVAAMNGDITLLDGSHRGCLVRVRLPPAAIPMHAVVAPKPIAVVAAGVPPRVLVVDDESLVAKAACRSLQRDHDVQWVSSARAALDLFEAGARFDVMLCDVMMPEMTGIDLYVELQRRAHPIAERFIFVTGGAFTPDAQQFLETAGVVSLEKPYRQEDLRRAIHAKLAPAAAA